MREEDQRPPACRRGTGHHLSGVRKTDAAADEAMEHEGETVEARPRRSDEDPDMESGEDLEGEDFRL